jgi:hypothetical protein
MTPGADSPEQGHLDVAGKYLGWRAQASWNKSDFYDLFGPTKRSRKGLALRLGYDHFIIYDEPRRFEWSNDVAWFDKIDTLPYSQNVSSGYTRLGTVESRLNYTDVRQSIGAVDDEKGILWTAALSYAHAGGRDTPLDSGLARAGLDIGTTLPWAHSSLWLRTAIGAAAGKDEDPMASFYFGGFGNNWVDSGKVKRYREFYSLPGFEINEIAARRFAKGMVEWNLPPVIYESVGTPAFHLTWLRPALFAIGMRTDGGPSAPARTYSSVGGQVDLRFSVQHWYEMTLSAGVGTGFEGSQRKGTEWMVSLKIM